MQEFMRKFEQLNGKRGKVILEHYLFDRQVFYCDKLQTINDNEKVGLMLKNQQIFMSKPNVQAVEAQNYIYKMSDGRLTITIILK